MMQLKKRFRDYVSGTVKRFELYDKAVISFVDEYTSVKGKRMMRAVVSGNLYFGAYNQIVFDIMNLNIGVKGPFVLWVTKEGNKMISKTPEHWQSPEIKHIKGII